MSCNNGQPVEVLLVGQPNVGKSVLFGRLTRRYALASNYPGTTVEICEGYAQSQGRRWRIIDTPGIDSLEAGSDEERVTADLLRRRPDAILLQVADAKNLRRALLLQRELARLGRPMALALNMADEARRAGLSIDCAYLERQIGVPVVSVTAITGEGVEAVWRAVCEASVCRPAGCPMACGNCGVAALELAEQATTTRADRAATAGTASWTWKPATGVPLLLAVLAAFYYFVGVFGAQKCVGFLETEVFGRRVVPALAGVLPGHPWLFGQYGLISMGLTYALAIVLPIVTFFFLAFGVLEDSGYLPRLAVLCNALMQRIGLNGKAVLPLVLGLGCGTMAIAGARILPSRKDRVIAILLIGLAVPCSAQLGVLMALGAALSPEALATLVATVLIQLALVGRLAARALPGESGDFLIELPPMRWPRLSHLAAKTARRAWWFLREATPLFLAGSMILLILDSTGWLSRLTTALRPAVTGWLGLPEQTAGIFLLGFLRRDFGAAGLYALAQAGGLSAAQLAVALVTLTLFLPCIASLLMMAKELGWRTAAAIAGFIFPLAFLTGGVVRWVLQA